jgi:hypothetical protein
MANVNRTKYGAVSGEGYFKLALKCVHSAAPIEQGDLVYWDSTNHRVTKLDSDAHAASLAGIALQPSVISSNIDLASAPAEQTVAVGFGCVAELKTTAAETYYTGTVVYIGADSQTITTVAGANAVGTVVLPAGVASVTGAAGKGVNVLIKGKAFAV